MLDKQANGSNKTANEDSAYECDGCLFSHVDFMFVPLVNSVKSKCLMLKGYLWHLHCPPESNFSLKIMDYMFNGIKDTHTCTQSGTAVRGKTKTKAMSAFVPCLRLRR